MLTSLINVEFGHLVTYTPIRLLIAPIPVRTSFEAICLFGMLFQFLLKTFVHPKYEKNLEFRYFQLIDRK